MTSIISLRASCVIKGPYPNQLLVNSGQLTNTNHIIIVVDGKGWCSAIVMSLWGTIPFVLRVVAALILTILRNLLYLVSHFSYGEFVVASQTYLLIKDLCKSILLVYELLCLLLIKASHMWFLCSKPINLCIIFDGCNAPANVKLLFMRVLLVHLLFLIDAFHRFYL